jgi:hypothetical protein
MRNLAFLGVWLAVGCSAPPSGRLQSVTPCAQNTLCAIAAFISSGANAVRLRSESGSTLLYSLPVDGPQGDLTAVGLTAETSWRHVLEVQNEAGTWSDADSVTQQTAALPQALQDVKLAVTGAPPSGFLLTGVALDAGTVAAVAFDGTGAVRWYRLFSAAGIGDVKQQTDGHVTVFLGATRGWDEVEGHYSEVDVRGTELATFSAPAGSYTDDHELQVSGGEPWFFDYSLRALDATSLGGPADARVAAHQVLSGGHVVFDGWQHFGVADWREYPTTAAAWAQPSDLDHPNALSFAPDGSLLVSYRNLDAVLDLDPDTGAVRWQLGGRGSQLSFVGDPLGGFSAQHYVRLLSNGNLLLYDNGVGHMPQQTRVAEYTLDVGAHTATLIWQFHHTPELFTPVVGSVQRLANHDTFIGWGAAGVASFVTVDGQVLWEATLQKGSTGVAFYRLILLPSLLEHLDVETFSARGATQ